MVLLFSIKQISNVVQSRLIKLYCLLFIASQNILNNLNLFRVLYVQSCLIYGHFIIRTVASILGLKSAFFISAVRTSLTFCSVILSIICQLFDEMHSYV